MPTAPARSLPHPSAAPAQPRLGRHEERDTVTLVGELHSFEHGRTHAVLRVIEARDAGAGFTDELVMVSLEGTRMVLADRNGDGRCDAHDLRPGEQVTVRTRLPRGLRTLPPVVHARLIATHAA
jgi:hypothetical protein